VEWERSEEWSGMILNGARSGFLVSFEVSYCVLIHNEEQVRYVVQCTETHLSGFLFIAQRLVIACICITRNKLDMSCNAMKHILGVFFSLHRG